MAIDWANWTLTQDGAGAPASAIAAKRKPGAGSRRRSDVSPSPGPTALGAMLRDRGLVTDDQLSTAIARQKTTGRRLGQILVELEFVTPEAVLEALSQQLGVRTVRVNAHTVQPDAVSALAEKVARRHTAFPVQKIGTTLVVALASPKDLNALDDIRFASGCDVQTVLALEEEILSAINRYYRDEWLLPDSPASVVDAVVIDSPSAHPPVRDQAAERSAVAVLERIIARATADGASDIHLEPRQEDLRIRCRIDGTFRDLAIFDLALAPALVARIKVLSNMDLAEHRLPQDGRFSVTVGDQHLDVRTSTYPTVNGEKAVMRLLDSSGLRLHLDRIGLSGHDPREPARADPSARGHRADYRPDRQRQDLDAVRGARGARVDREEHRHHRRSGRVRAAGRQPGPDEQQGRVHVRGRHARGAPAGPRRDHGG
jgi:hypothetical protein